MELIFPIVLQHGWESIWIDPEGVPPSKTHFLYGLQIINYVSICKMSFTRRRERDERSDFCGEAQVEAIGIPAVMFVLGQWLPPCGILLIIIIICSSLSKNLQCGVDCKGTQNACICVHPIIIML